MTPDLNALGGMQMTSANTKSSNKIAKRGLSLPRLRVLSLHYLKAHLKCTTYAFCLCFAQLSLLEPAFAAAAATLNFEQGITDGVNPLLKLILTHNGKAIFLSSAVGMLIGGGNGDGWARLKMGGLWAIGAAALIHIMKGTLGVQMPG